MERGTAPQAVLKVETSAQQWVATHAGSQIHAQGHALSFGAIRGESCFERRIVYGWWIAERARVAAATTDSCLWPFTGRRYAAHARGCAHPGRGDDSGCPTDVMASADALRTQLAPTMIAVQTQVVPTLNAIGTEVVPTVKAAATTTAESALRITGVRLASTEPMITVQNDGTGRPI